MIIFKNVNLKILVISCVKVGASGLYSEGVTPTTVEVYENALSRILFASFRIVKPISGESAFYL